MAKRTTGSTDNQNGLNQVRQNLITALHEFGYGAFEKLLKAFRDVNTGKPYYDSIVEHAPKLFVILISSPEGRETLSAMGLEKIVNDYQPKGG